MTVTWLETEDGLKPFLEDTDKEVAWAPQQGSQEALLQSPIFETLLEGNRGGGKTDVLIMDFAQHIGLYGQQWRGILFRQSYPQLEDVISKTKEWFPRIWPDADFNQQRATWTWPSGEMLLLRHIIRTDDYWNYHGHSYPWIGWEELTTWPSPDCYTVMMSCCRTKVKGMPLKYRSTTNPYGPGHNWVKARWRLPIISGMIGPVIDDCIGKNGELEPPRVAIHSSLSENKVLLYADPNYIRRIAAAARNKSEAEAWIKGSWDIVAGGMFDDLWDPSIHVIPDIPLNKVPPGWIVNRSYDHGQSKPFSVGWWAESNGEPIRLEGNNYGGVPGDLFRIAEWYGWTGQPNEGLRMTAVDISKHIKQKELDWKLAARVQKGVADASIFDDYEPGRSVAGDMAIHGVKWYKSDKSPNSRMHGWEQIRKLLQAALPGQREYPGLFICERCDQFMRMFPVLPRSNKNIDDVDTNAEDHLADEVRYRVRYKHKKLTSRDF